MQRKTKHPVLKLLLIFLLILLPFQFYQPWGIPHYDILILVSFFTIFFISAKRGKIYVPNPSYFFASGSLLFGFIFFLLFSNKSGDFFVAGRFLFTIVIFLYVIQVASRFLGTKKILSTLLVVALFLAFIEVFELLSNISVSSFFYSNSYFYGRRAAVFPHPNRLSSFLVLSLPYVLYLYDENERNIKWLIVGLILYFSIFTIGSMSGILGSLFVLFIALVIWAQQKKSKFLIVLFSAIIFSVIAFRTSVINDVLNDTISRALNFTGTFHDSSFVARVFLYQEAFKILSFDIHNMFFGIGFRGILLHFQIIYGKPYFIHNLILNTFLAWGILGFIGVSIFMIDTFITAMRVIIKSKSITWKVSIAISGLLVIYFFQVFDAFNDKTLWLYIGLIEAIDYSQFN